MSENAQIIFKFPAQDDMSRANYMPMPCHENALNVMEKVAQDGQGVVCLYGASGVGKSHIVRMFAHEKKWHMLHAADLQELDLRHTQVVVDGLDGLSKLAQENLFHLFNHIKSQHGILVVTSQMPVAQQEMIPELQSRLLTGVQVDIASPSEMELEMLVIKWAHDRQIVLDPAVVRYLLSRCARDVAGVRHVLTLLDEASLQKKRAITVPLVREVLEKAGA